MATYKVIASYETYVYANIEASSEQEAHEIAESMDGGEFENLDDNLGNWRICEIEKL